MRKLNLVGTFFTLAVTLLFGMPQGVFAKNTLDLVIFGDSLSDTGNRFFVTGIKNTPPYDLVAQENLVPSSPYAIGGATYTNGSVWIELFARAVSRGGASQAVQQSNGAASNYAYAGARASNDPPLDDNGNLNFIDQVGQYLADVNHSASPDALHIIFVGGNDVTEAVGAYLQIVLPDPTNPDLIALAQDISQQIISNSVQSMFSRLGALRAAGAERFMIVLPPNAGYSPLFAAAGPFGPLIGAGAANGFNCAIAGAGVNRVCDPPIVPTLVQWLQSTSAQVAVLDGQAIFDDIISNPGSYGINDTTNHCVTPFEPPYRCRNANEYVYWDNIHPTTRVHEILGEAAIELMSP